MIRRATVLDVVDIVDLTAKTARSIPYDIGFDPGHFACVVFKLLKSEGLALISERDRLTGFILAVLDIGVYGSHVRGAKVTWVSEHPGDGARLLKAAEEWARSQGATRFTASAPDPRSAKLLKRLGYAEVETSFEKAL